MPWNEDDVANFIVFTNAPAEDARAWLDRYGATEPAIQHYFDNNGVLPKPVAAQSQFQQSQWDESAFHSGRDIYGPETRPPEFNIQGPDQMETPRPNSRVENWVNDSAITEADQIKMATERSMQQNGVVDTGQHFQRVADDHQKSNFQLTAFTGMAFNMNESVAPPADQRGRYDADTPVFVRPSSTREGHLASLLTILYNIPLAREVMISGDKANTDYGDDPTWWNGTRISNTEDAAEWESSSDFDKARETFSETQRIMAALGGTERAYISSDVLEAMVKNGSSITILLRDFFERWVKGGSTPMNEKDSESMRAIFESTLVNGREESENPIIERLFVLAPQVQEATNGFEQSLISVLGNTFIEQYSNDGPVWFEQLAKVLVLELEPAKDRTRLDIKIPACFNARMFLQDPPEQFQKVFDDHRDLIRRSVEMREQARNLDYARTPTGNIPYQQLLDATIKHLAEKPTPLVTQVSKPGGSEDDLMELDTVAPSIDAIVKERLNLIKQLRATKADIIESQGHLKEEVEAATEAIGQNLVKLDNLHTATVEDYPDSKYELCGVATSYDTIYVRILPRKPEEEDLLVDEDAEEATPQWWRIEFTHGNPCSFNHQKVRGVEVRHAAEDAREKVLLVYGSPEALSAPHSELPPALKTFVEVDNESFKLELQARENRFDDSMQTTVEVDPAYAEPPPYDFTPNWGGERDQDYPPQLTLGQLPALPPRSAQADNSSMEAGSSGGSELGGRDAGQNVTKKRGSRWTGIKKALSRSKSRERSTQPDLLTDNAEQIKGASTMAPNGKLGVPGGGHEDKKPKR